MLKFKIYVLGCKVNQYDAGILRNKLISFGFKETQNNVDIAVIVTCAVTKIAVRKSKQMINKAKKENPKAKIIISGCCSKIYKKEIEKRNIDVITNISNFNNVIKKILNNNKIKTKNKLNLQNIYKSRYFIKIQDGCEQFCSYCIIPYTRGKLKSRNEQEILDEIKEAVLFGYKEIILCGIHLGLYGKGRTDQKNCSLVKLIKKIIKIKNLGKIRLSSIEINDINDELIKLIAKSNKICRHLHIPLQAGSDKILKLMNRPYNKKYFLDKVKKIRKKNPQIAITTDVIVGFPNEDDKDFKETVEFIKKINFSRLHIFSFSEHEKTPASKLQNKVNINIIKERRTYLQKLNIKLEKQYRKKFNNKIVSAVIEKILDNKIKAKTEFYFDIEFNKKLIKNEDCRIKNIINIKLN